MSYKFLRSPMGSINHLKSEDSKKAIVILLMVYYSKIMQGMHGVKISRNQVQASQGLLPVKLHRRAQFSYQP